MDVVEPYVVMARYNAWMNQKLYAAAGTLTDEERRRDRVTHGRNHSIGSSRLDGHGVAFGGPILSDTVTGRRTER